MSTVLRFRRSSKVTAVTGDGLYVTTERGARTRLAGPGVVAAYPLLDGTRSRAQVLTELADVLGDSAAQASVAALLRTGHVVEADPSVDVKAAGYWEQHGFEGDATVRTVANTRVSLVALGAAADLDVVAALARAGLRSNVVRELSALDADDAPLTMVVTDDYGREELREVNASMLAAGRAWMLVKPLGSLLWVGPIFTPGATACYECLRARLACKSLTESYFRQRGVLDGVLVDSVTALASSTHLGLDLAAQTAALWLARRGTPARRGIPAGADGVDPRRDGDVVTLDSATLESRRHHLDPRPQCPACGDPAIQSRRLTEPVALVPRPKAQTSDGGHRALPPERFVEAYQHFVSPITGPVSHLTKLPMSSPGLHVYTAGQNFAMPMRTLADLKAGLRSSSCGKGISDSQAKASALGEAIERYSGVFHGDETRIVRRFADFADGAAIHPNDLHLFSAAQFADRASWNARPSHFHWVGEELEAQRPVEWTPLWSLTEGRQKWLPTSTMYYAYHSAAHPFLGSSNSNGCAAGASLEDAILQGFMELVERDATAIWWYNRLRRPRIDLDSFADPYFAHWQEAYRRVNRETWVLDLTTDLGIPTVVSVSYRVDKPAEDILFALGSHFDVRIAIGRALSEMNQFLPAVVHMPTDGGGTYAFDDPVQVDWWQTARIADHPYLAPDDTRPARTAADFVDVSTDDLADDVRLCADIVARAGMEMLVLDQTRPDIGLPVARVVVPGMRHFWPRYAPGRLYDVPVAQGWLDAPTPEDSLNPIAIFL